MYFLSKVVQHDVYDTIHDFLCRCLMFLQPWASAGGCRGVRMLPLEFENDDAICCFPVQYPNFSLALSALAIITPKFSSTWLVLTALNFVSGAENLQKWTVFSIVCKKTKKVDFG